MSWFTFELAVAVARNLERREPRTCVIIDVRLSLQSGASAFLPSSSGSATISASPTILRSRRRRARGVRCSACTCSTRRAGVRLAARRAGGLPVRCARSTRSLHAIGSRLTLMRGAAARVVPALAAAIGADAVHWNRRYDRAGNAVDGMIEDAIRTSGGRVETFHANLLFEPGDTSPRVFTPFWRRMRAGAPPRQPLPAPSRLAAFARRRERMS